MGLLPLLTLRPAQAQTDFARPAESSAFLTDARQSGTTASARSATLLVDTRAMEPEQIHAVTPDPSFRIDTRLNPGAGTFTLSGIIKSSTGTLVGGCSASLVKLGTVMHSTVTTNAGTYQFPAVAAQTYHLKVEAPGYLPVMVDINGNQGSNQTRNLTLSPLPPLPQLAEKGRPPGSAEVNPKAVTVSAHLRVYGSSGWTGLTNDKWPTVILTHGWRSSSADWPAEMALKISQRFTNTYLNILAWDWKEEAASGTGQPVPSDKTLDQGTQLGQALYAALGPGYAERIHFIGHSLGTLVNRYACDYLYPGNTSRWPAATALPHMTLLDEAEVASVQGAAVIATALTTARQGLAQAAAELTWQDAASPVIAGLSTGSKITLETLNATIGKAVEDWKSPVPRQYAYIDNYVSLFGGTLDVAANVCLAAPPEDFLPIPSDPFSWFLLPLERPHAYAYRWYQDSIGFIGTVPMGFSRAAETGAVVPPTNPAYQAGTVWHQSSGPNRYPMSLTRVTERFKNECTYFTLLNRIAAPGQIVDNAVKATLEFAGGVAQTVGEVYKTAVVDMTQLTVNSVKKTGNVVVETGVKTGQFINATTDKAWNATINLTSDLLLKTPLFSSTSRFTLKPGGSVPRNAGAARNGSGIAGPGIWITLTVPENAGLLAFDFTVRGDLGEDCIVAAVAGANIFHLPAKYLTGDLTQSSDMLDISDHAGQEVEFFFGLGGGTAQASAEAVIEGIRFITIPTPTLALENHGTTVSLYWPAAASGWRLEASETMAADSWEGVEPPTPESFTVIDGVNRLVEPRSPEKQFYRLHRVAQ